MGHNAVVNQGFLILSLSIPDPSARPGTSAGQTKKKKQNIIQRTTYSILYADGRLECYPGDPFSVGSRYEASKATNILYISQTTGWASVTLVADNSDQPPEECLSFAIRRKPPISNQSNNWKHLGLDAELMALPTSPTSNTSDLKDRKTLKGFLGIRGKRTKSVGTRSVSLQSINVLDSSVPPLPTKSIDGLSDLSRTSHCSTLLKSQPLTQQDLQFNQALPDPLIFSVDSIPAKLSWIKGFEKVLVDPPQVLPSNDLPIKLEFSRHVTPSDLSPLMSSPASSPHLNLTLPSSSLPGHESDLKPHPLTHSSSIGCLSTHKITPVFKSSPLPSAISLGAELPSASSKPCVTHPTTISKTPAPTPLASPFTAPPKPSVLPESTGAVPAWIKSVRNANEKKIGLESAASSPIPRAPNSLVQPSIKSQSSQASLNMSSAFSASNNSAYMSDRRGTFGHGNGISKFTPFNQLRSIGNSVVTNLKRSGSNHESSEVLPVSHDGGPKVVDDDHSSKSSDLITSSHAYSFEASSLDAFEVGPKDKAFRFLLPKKKRIGSIVEVAGTDLSDSSPAIPHNSSNLYSLSRTNSISDQRSNSKKLVSEPTSFRSTPAQIQREREADSENFTQLYPMNAIGDSKTGFGSGQGAHPYYTIPSLQDSHLGMKTPHSKESFTEWLSAAAGQAAHELESPRARVPLGSADKLRALLPTPQRGCRRVMSGDAKSASENASLSPATVDSTYHSDRSPSTTISEETPSHKMNCSLSPDNLDQNSSSSTPHHPRFGRSIETAEPKLANDKWVTNHIIPPQELIHQLQPSASENSSLWLRSPARFSDNAQFLKSLSENQQLALKQSGQNLKAALAGSDANGDVGNAEPGSHDLATSIRPQIPGIPFPKVKPQAVNSVPSLPVPARRRRRQNSNGSTPNSKSTSAQSSTSKGNELSESQSQMVSSRLPNHRSRTISQDSPSATHVMRMPSHKLSISDLASAVDDDFGDLGQWATKENDENLASEVYTHDGMTTKAIKGQPANDFNSAALTPTYKTVFDLAPAPKSSFGQNLYMNSNSLSTDNQSYRRGSQSTLRGL
ncbi:uncharacterized protein MELLADRAFT_115880 [Melampsora larici-populina 98AG31]|uniref:Uncharacterized protein n=1 Tax=Melampsora larici-populina (strain 98AG31 / pathotype 3-4-7) TaxID=747676 RepID=F4RFB4_MELLP|nr:uncharacterized protein MELLADRAFT_115880 [Melampsora larici-populina 98AG31]EGG08784.1 hypothetical protein MELLADRAFT_115880 [Melampsora larici-populina 98AG31]